MRRSSGITTFLLVLASCLVLTPSASAAVGDSCQSPNTYTLYVDSTGLQLGDVNQGVVVDTSGGMVTAALNGSTFICNVYGADSGGTAQAGCGHGPTAGPYAGQSPTWCDPNPSGVNHTVVGSFQWV